MKNLLILSATIILFSCSTTSDIVKNSDTAKIAQQEVTNTISSLGNSWLLSSINGKSIPKMAEGNKIPQLKFDTKKMQVSGNDGCNQINGSLKKLDQSNLVFGLMMGTKMMCPKMATTDKFEKALSLVKTYKVAKDKLSLFGIDGKEVLQFVKSN